MSDIVCCIISTLTLSSGMILAVWSILSEAAPIWTKIIGSIYILVILFTFGFVLGGGGRE